MKMTLFEKYFTFGTTRGERVPVLTEKINVSALYKRHAKSGFVILSANLSNKDQEYNERMTGNLISDLAESGFRYLPVYGGYRGTNGVEDDYEPSFLVFPYDRDGIELDFDDLEDFALDMCKKYRQESIFVLRPDEVPHYLDANGEPIEKRSSKKLFVNDLTQQFFMSFKNREDVEKEVDAKLMRGFKKFRGDHPYVSFDEYKREHLKDVKSIGRRFTADIEFSSPDSEDNDEKLFVESMTGMYVNPPYRSLQELQRRLEMGEIVLGKKGGRIQVY